MKKRVLQIIASLDIGGAEKVARDIGLYREKQRYDVDYVVFGKAGGAYEGQLTDAGCRIIQLKAPKYGYRAYLAELRQLIRHNSYDVVHCHTMFNSGWAMLAAKQAGVPVRVTHAHSALINGSGLKKNLYEALMRALILSCGTDLLACGNAAGCRLFGTRAYKSRGTLVLNGVDIERYAYDPERRERTRAALGITDRYVIGHVGHFLPVKNQMFLVRLLPEILKIHRDAELLLLGDGPERPLIEKAVGEAGLTDRVILTGNVSDVGSYLSAMDVFAFPSLYEGMPLSILEVQANGLPCILSDRVPKDVFLTDLLTALPLDAPQEEWVEAICASKRIEPEQYPEKLRNLGINTERAIAKVFEIYEKVGCSA